MVLTVAALVAAMMSTGPAKANISSGASAIKSSGGRRGLTNGVDNSPVFVQSNSDAGDVDIGDVVFGAFDLDDVSHFGNDGLIVSFDRDLGKPSQARPGLCSRPSAYVGKTFSW